MHLFCQDYYVKFMGEGYWQSINMTILPADSTGPVFDTFLYLSTLLKSEVCLLLGTFEDGAITPVYVYVYEYNLNRNRYQNCKYNPATTWAFRFFSVSVIA